MPISFVRRSATRRATRLYALALGLVLAPLRHAAAQDAAAQQAPADPPTVTFAALHSFAGGSGDGALPHAALVQAPNGTFYGTCIQGGTSNNGVVFSYVAGGSPVVRHAFSGTDGSAPFAPLVMGMDGNFYGVTIGGGAGGKGTVFRMSATAPFTLTTLHSFTATDSSGINADGAAPNGALVQAADGKFYGTTIAGGKHGAGVVFRVNPAAPFTFATLHSFTAPVNGSNADGANPYAALTEANGKLYGTASAGGANGQGVVFKIGTTAPFMLTTLHSFTAAEGNQPEAPLVPGTDGLLYGTTVAGGDSGLGTVFRIAPTGTHALTTLYSFQGHDTDGTSPFAPLILGSDGAFYGTTRGGGPHQRGSVFKLMATLPVTVTFLHYFTDTNGSNANSDGAYPTAALVQGFDSKLYGTASGGGTQGKGTLFRIDLGQ